jgi:hypothetical protein
MTTVQELATQFRSHFTEDTRANGEKFWKAEYEGMEGLDELIRTAHSDMMPEDWKYQFIVDALEAIAESDDPDSPELEADVYNSDHLRWLSSNLTRAEYVDEWVSNFGIEPSKFNLFEAIGGGQWTEREEVYWLVLSSLRELVKTTEDDGEA